MIGSLDGGACAQSTRRPPSSGPHATARASGTSRARVTGQIDAGCRKEAGRQGFATVAEPAAARAAQMSSERTLPEMEREALVQALQRVEGNVTRAARELGVSRDTLRCRVEKYGLEAQMRQVMRDNG